MLHLSGPLAKHAGSVVMPFLLPDTPVVAWWPDVAPASPATDPLGRLAIRRITDATNGVDPLASIKTRLAGYAPGDTDLAWSRITYWRALLASAIELAPHEPITSATVSGIKDEPAVDMIAGWLASRLDCPVNRTVGPLKVELVRPSETITLTRPQDGVTATLIRTGRPDALRSITMRCRGWIRCAMSETLIETYADSAELATAAGARLVGAITSAVAARGVAYIVLTGGGTGTALLRHVAEYGLDIPWSKVHLFWGDDRFVAHDDDERNVRQAYGALLGSISIPTANVHPMAASDGEFGGDIEAAALAYERKLAALPGAPTPEFDVHLLGMGGEGHINSLFPDTAAVRETGRMVVAVTDSPKPPPRRITLTLPAVRRSREVWLVVSGAAKAEAVAAAVGGADPVDVPAAGAIGREKTVWLLDTAAATLLPSS